MADAGRVIAASPPRGWADPVLRLRVAIVLFVLVAWETIAWSATVWPNFLYRDVIPSWLAIGKGVATLLANPEYYWHLGVTASEIGTGLVIGGLPGIVVGILLGSNRTLAKAYEPYLYYLGPTPKIIFFPIMIMWFGVGPGSKVAMGAISCFFPIALSAAAGMRQIDKVLIRVGKSFRANTWQMATKIYLPAMRLPVVNGVRLGLGVAIIGTLLAETRLSNRGVGFLIQQAYSLFDMPRMYAMLIVLFVLAIGANALVGRIGRFDAIQQR